MAPRRGKRGGRRSRRTYTLNCNFFGWYDTSTGYIKNIRADAIGMSTSRQLLLKSVTMHFSATATTSTYMIPSNAPCVTLLLADGNGSTVATSSTVLIPFGLTKSITVRTPRQTPMTTYGASTTVIAIHVSQPAPNTTLSYSGLARIHPSRNLQPYGVKLEDTIAELNDRFSLMQAEFHDASSCLDEELSADNKLENGAFEIVASDQLTCCPRCSAERASQSSRTMRPLL